MGAQDTILLLSKPHDGLDSAFARFGYQLVTRPAATPIHELFTQETPIDLVVYESTEELPAQEMLDFLKNNEQTRGIPIVVIGSLEECERIKAHHESSVDVVPRPYSLGRLVSCVATRLRLSKIAGKGEDATIAQMLAAQRDLTNRVQKELEEARAIQQNLLPKVLPDDARYELAVVYEPVEEVGGDWYTAVREASGKLTLQIADVTGHGLSAAFIGSMTKLAFHAAADEEPSVRLTEMNRLMSPMLPEGRFVTVVSLLYDPATGEVAVARAGHPPPLVIHRATHTSATLTPDGFPIGFFDAAEYAPAKEVLEKGDIILLYTDGLSEAQNRNFECYGAERVSRVLRETPDHFSVREIVSALFDDFEQFIDGRRINDDLSLIALKRTA